MDSYGSRRATARELRERMAEVAFRRPHPHQLTNGEESAYASYIANYSKGLPHNAVGEVLPHAYRALLRALQTGNPQDFQAIPLSDQPVGRHRQLINPQAGLAWDLEGPDAHALMMPPAPRVDGPQVSAEMAELYWMALARDVSFIEYGTGTGSDLDSVAGGSLTGAAAGALATELTDYQGLPTSAATANATLFRSAMPGCDIGPYVSQFLIKDIPYGPYRIVQWRPTAVPGTDFMTDFVEWLDIQNGAMPTRVLAFDCAGTPPMPVPRRLRTLRDLAYHVRVDVSYQHYLNACFILQHMALPATAVMPADRNPPGDPCLTADDPPPCMSGPLDGGNPYLPPAYPPRVEEGFATFGNWHIPSLLAEVATRALKAVWYQKWYIHRRLRPEALGGLIDNHLSGRKAYPMLDQEILDALLTGSLSAYVGPAMPSGSYLLPQAFPEGSPLHPSYGEGHGVVGGACVTILKAWFDEAYQFDPASANRFEIPQEPDADGIGVHDYTGGSLTVGGELNKLVANISLGGRSGAGVHYRSDSDEALRLGETIAIGLLQEQMRTYNEGRVSDADVPPPTPPSFTLTRFDGTAIKIRHDGTIVTV